MLSRTEQEDLLAVIDVIFEGEHRRFRRLKGNFNERTVELVEQAMEELIQCNQSMKSLVVSLVGGISVFSRGWL